MELLERALAEALTEREALVLRLRLGLGGGREHTLKDVGRMLGVTRERVRQIESGALKKLGKHLGVSKDEVTATPAPSSTARP